MFKIVNNHVVVWNEGWKAWYVSPNAVDIKQDRQQVGLEMLAILVDDIHPHNVGWRAVETKPQTTFPKTFGVSIQDIER